MTAQQLTGAWALAAFIVAAIAVPEPAPMRILGFAPQVNSGVDGSGQLAYDVPVDAVAPKFGSLALGVATQGPYTLVGSMGDATPIAVDGAGRVICVAPEGGK